MNPADYLLLTILAAALLLALRSIRRQRCGGGCRGCRGGGCHACHGLPQEK